LLLREWPITGGPATGNKPEVSLDQDSIFAAASVLDVGEYAIADEDTIIVRLGALWPLGTRNIKVVYEAGVGTLGTDIPSDLENACIEFVGWMYKRNNDRRIGIESKTKGGETVRFIQGIPAFIDIQLEPYMRSEFPVTNAPVLNS